MVGTRTQAVIQLCGLYRTSPALRPNVLEAIVAGIAGIARQISGRSNKVLLGLSMDQIYLFTAPSRLSGWGIGDEIGRVERRLNVCSRLEDEPFGLQIILPTPGKALRLYPLYDTEDIREIRRILCPASPQS